MTIEFFFVQIVEYPLGEEKEDFIEILRRPEGLQFTIAWRSFSLFFFVIPFTLFFNLFTLVAIVDLFSKGQFLTILFVGGILGTVGISMVYFCLCSFFNKTTIRVSRGKLEITHGPWKSFSQNQYLKTADLKQFFVRQRPHLNKNRTTDSYQLWVKKVKGKDILLLVGFSSREEAEFLEKEIEQFLEIEDKPV